MTNNFAQFIIDIGQSRLDKLALVDETKSLTYQDLTNYIYSFSYHLQQSGVHAQDRVIISMEDCVEWPVAFLSILAIGGNPVLVSADLPMSTIEKVCTIADAKFVIGKEIPNIKCFPKETILHMLDYQLEHFYQYHPDEMCFWLLSSGTTGEPKCVVHRHRDLKTLLDIIANPAYCIDEHSRILSTAKLSFTYGFNNSLTFGLGKGATVYLINGAPAPSKIFAIINRHSITHFFTVPTVINSMIKHGQTQTLSESVKVMVSSGEPLPRSIAQAFEAQHSIKILDGLGMSECMYNYCTTTLDNNEFGTIGRPVVGVECEVRNDDGSLSADGDIGEMWVRHPCSALQYWKDWSKTKNTFIGEWIRTGDKVIKQLNGNYLYVARRDDLIKINGQYVSPIEIESVVLEIDWVLECGVVAKTNEQGLNEIHAFVTASKSTTAGEIRQYLSNVLPSYKIPKHIHFLDILPKTVTYKKTRSKLRSMLEINS
jgi:benzoate-CoA ligase